MKRALAYITIVVSLILCGCSSTQGGAQNSSSSTDTSTTDSAAAHTEIIHRYASASEGKDLLLSNDTYYAGFSQNDLDFRVQKTGATMEEYQAFAAEQVLDFTDEEKALFDGCLAEMELTLVERGYTLPPLGEVVFVKTTGAEECHVAAYTHGTTIFVSTDLLALLSDPSIADEEQNLLPYILWHELFHCLTRCNPDFRADMYKLIHFTVHDEDYVLPPSVMDYHISNPDVEHHDSSALFNIDGRDVECFTDFVTTQHFESAGDEFFDYSTTALVPVDGTDTFYTPDQATNFDEVFGRNTDYVVDPEECMADNFSLALTFGMDGNDGNGWASPEIIEGIIAYLSR